MRTIRISNWLGCAALGLALAPWTAWSAAPAPQEHSPRLKSAMAIVVDQDTDEVLYEKNADHVSSIASITKLMTAMVTLDAQLPPDEDLVVTSEDRANGWATSRLRPGTHLTRAKALHLALMSSENHAAQ